MLTALAFAAGVGLAWLCYRGDTRLLTPASHKIAHNPHPSGNTRLGWLDPARFDTPFDRDWTPHPDWAPWLAAWDAEVDGLPWANAGNWTRPIDVRTETDVDGALVHRIIPERPSTAMVRRIVTEAAA